MNAVRVSLIEIKNGIIRATELVESASDLIFIFFGAWFLLLLLDFLLLSFPLAHSFLPKSFKIDSFLSIKVDRFSFM